MNKSIIEIFENPYKHQNEMKKTVNNTEVEMESLNKKPTMLKL